MNTATIGSKIKNIRELKNLTQEYLADRVGVNQSTYSRFESDVTDLTIDNLSKIAEALGVTPSEILDFDKAIYFASNTELDHSGIINSTVNDFKLVEELIKAKDQTIKALLAQIEVLERNLKK